MLHYNQMNENIIFHTDTQTHFICAIKMQGDILMTQSMSLGFVWKDDNIDTSPYTCITKNNFFLMLFEFLKIVYSFIMNIINNQH